MDKEELIIKLSNNYREIIHRNSLKNTILDWGNNGIGNRWAGGKYNYSVITKKDTKLYSNYENDSIPVYLLSEFRKKITSTQSGIIGIFVHSKKTELNNIRPIRNDIKKSITKLNCVVCGSSSEIVCDHKNDLYNDIRVLNSKTQKQTDFQPLCNHCNLQKRQVSKDEKKNKKIYSAKNIPSIAIKCNFVIPWEKKVFDEKCITTKEDTFWYDPIEFNRKLNIYILYKLLVVDKIRKIEPVKQVEIVEPVKHIEIVEPVKHVEIVETTRQQVEPVKKVKIVKCNYIYLKGKNKGQECSTYTKLGVKCSKHR